MPRAEAQFSAPDWCCGGCTDQRGLDVRVGVALRMPITRIFADELSQLRFDVAGNVGIGALVDRHACGGVLHEYVADAFRHPRTLDQFIYLVSDVEQLHAQRGLDLKSYPPHVISVSRDGVTPAAPAIRHRRQTMFERLSWSRESV